MANFRLTRRECEVLQLIAIGHCNKTIARDLGISVETVKSHVKNILAKLGAKARTHAVALATRRGLLGKCSECGLISQNAAFP